jgi:2-polyprenyl-3-methyl-5-hydroxy-6-metoxy-1,4-benzoquinol methylase
MTGGTVFVPAGDPALVWADETHTDKNVIVVLRKRSLFVKRPSPLETGLLSEVSSAGKLCAIIAHTSEDSSVRNKYGRVTMSETPIPTYSAHPMIRMPEPELMTEKEQAAAYAAANFAEVNEPVARWFQARFSALAPGARLLDIGCGTADMTIRLVRAYPGITALGIDGSEAMLSYGSNLVNQAGLNSRIQLECRYFPDAALGIANFDAVTANNLLHHLADPGSFWRAVLSCARPGAPIMVADLRRPSDTPTVESLVEQYAWRALPPLRRDFFNSLHAAYTADEVRQQLDEAGLTGLQVEEVGPLHLVAWGYGA